MGIYRCNIPNGDEVAKFGHVQNKAQINKRLSIYETQAQTFIENPRRGFSDKDKGLSLKLQSKC